MFCSHVKYKMTAFETFGVITLKSSVKSTYNLVQSPYDLVNRVIL